MKQQKWAIRYGAVYGWGTIHDINREHIYPINACFRNCKRVTHAWSGKVHDDEVQTLFWDEIKFEVPTKPTPELKVDTKVIVWLNEAPTNKKRRYFSHFTNGKINCFNFGATSWNEHKTAEWDNWELADE